MVKIKTKYVNIASNEIYEVILFSLEYKVFICCPYKNRILAYDKPVLLSEEVIKKEFTAYNEDYLNKYLSSITEREIEVAVTIDGKYIVEWFDFNSLPPPKGKTKLEALELFLEYFLEKTKATSKEMSWNIR